MGISFHLLKFLELAREEAPLGDVLTFGRQNLNVTQAVVEREFGKQAKLSDYRFADELLVECLGAASVSSVDNSAYEGATYIADMNGPIELGRTFDLVIDAGTLEHVYDVANGFRNAIAHCKVGGRIIHASPSNSDCGHGFYQFSPELMFSLYSEANGFRNTVVYVVKMMDERHWWRASPPQAGKRLMANSLSTTYLLCRTEKVADVAQIRVQQSDYEHAWEVGQATIGDRANSIASRGRRAFKDTFLADVATLGYRTWLAKTGITRFNPDLERVSIDALTSLPR